MAYDAVIKMLVDAKVPGFFRLLRAPPDRVLTETETGHPRVLRLDHVSCGTRMQDILHIEFQASNEDMRCRMLEYYSAIARKWELHLRPPRVPTVRQIVVLVGRATQRASVLERDRIRFNFEVLRMDSLDPERTLLASSDPFEKVLGLLCVEKVHNEDWFNVLRGIDAARRFDPDRAVDAVALLVVVAEQLLKVPERVLPAIRNAAVRLGVEESSIFGALIAEQRRLAAEEARLAERREGLLLMVRMAGHRSTTNDLDFIQGLDSNRLKNAQQGLVDGQEWSYIRHSGVPPAPGE